MPIKGHLCIVRASCERAFTKMFAKTARVGTREAQKSSRLIYSNLRSIRTKLTFNKSSSSQHYAIFLLNFIGGNVISIDWWWLYCIVGDVSFIWNKQNRVVLFICLKKTHWFACLFSNEILFDQMFVILYLPSNVTFSANTRKSWRRLNCRTWQWINVALNKYRRW